MPRDGIRLNKIKKFLDLYYLIPQDPGFGCIVMRSRSIPLACGFTDLFRSGILGVYATITRKTMATTVRKQIRQMGW